MGEKKNIWIISDHKIVKEKTISGIWSMIQAVSGLKGSGSSSGGKKKDCYDVVCFTWPVSYSIPSQVHLASMS